MWAPWCHTCLSMQSYVLSDPGLAPLAERFVFAAVDTDREVNAAVVEAYPVSTWPTFFVVSPEDGAVQARFVGAATVAQWRELLATGEHGYLEAQARSGALTPGSPAALLRDAERAVIARDLAAADKAYTAALAAAPADWPRRADALVSLIQTRYKRNDTAGCLDLALERTAATTGDAGRTASATDFLAFALRCAEEQAAAQPDKVKTLRERAVARLGALVDDAAAPLAVDDRSDALVNLREALAALGDKDKAIAMAERQRVMLDEAAAKAPTPLAAMTYNWPRAEVYAYLGKPLELVPALEKSAADLPKEYDPPYRLAWIYLQAKQPQAALPWAEKALALAYGPRKARVQALVADLHKARGDRAAERNARVALVAIYEGLPAGMAQPDALAAARAALVAMDAAATPAAGAK
jgi:thiol-disulfide isomerase/thioredoxin